MVNAVLLEHGHEEYRHKLARLGLPAYDIHEMITNVDGIHNGVEGLLFKTGQAVFGEHLVLNTLPKDVADSHLSGDIHLTNTGIWSLLPDTIFVNIKELLEDGIDLRGKFLGVTRMPPIKTLDDLITSLSLLTSLLLKEVSQEVIIDGLVTVLQKFSKNLSEVEEKIANAFAITSTAPKYNENSALASFRIQLGSDSKVIGAILAGYKKYIKSTPLPQVGLIIDYEKGKVTEFSDVLSEIIALGGRIIFSKGHISNHGILRGDTKNTGTSINLQALSINLPRLAFESNKDETYFRARLAILMKPALAAMSLRKKDISDLTRRGLNPILASNTQYMQKGSVTLVVNLIGLKEAVLGILGYENNKAGNEIITKVLETAIEVAAKKGKEMGDNVTISMTESDASTRFSTLDGEKYGKMSIHQFVEGDAYSAGMTLNATEIEAMTLKTDKIVECNHISKMLNGGLLIQLKISNDMDTAGIKKTIEKTSELVGSFRPIRKVSICGNCGLKDEKITDKCPTCKSPYILA
jgi:ribonucleoside-triphosphate reductase